MKALALWFSEAQQKLMTRLVNRTFKRDPGFLDRLAVRLIRRAYGPVEPDPELEHFEFTDSSNS